MLTMADVAVKKRSFDVAFNVEYAEMNTNRGAASTYSVNEKQVRQWRLRVERNAQTKRREDGWWKQKSDPRYRGGGVGLDR